MKSGFKKFLPAFVLDMFSGMAASKYASEMTSPTEPAGRRKGKAKGGGNGRGFLIGLPHRSARGTALGAAMIRYGTGHQSKYGRPNEEGMRELMEPNWHRTFMGKTR